MSLGKVLSSFAVIYPDNHLKENIKFFPERINLLKPKPFEIAIREAKTRVLQKLTYLSEFSCYNAAWGMKNVLFVSKNPFL